MSPLTNAHSSRSDVGSHGHLSVRYSSDMADVRDEVLSVLSRRARFVPELARLVHAEEPELERALRELETDGAVLLREQYCADPHMVGTDLRIAARVPEPADGV